MHRLFKILLLLVITGCFSGKSIGQSRIVTGIVRDKQSEEPIPFASVSFINSTVGKLTDSAGTFTLFIRSGIWPSDTLEVTTVGYLPFRVATSELKDSVFLDIYLERGTFNETVKIKAKVNPGIYLWRKVVEHKEENDRYRFSNFSYELYNKLEIDLKNINFQKFSKIKPLKPVTDLIKSNIDSSESLPYLPAYLTEVISDYYYQKKPLKRREVILASNTNGVNNESFTRLLGGMDQNVNIYNNFIPVFDKQFVSPASDNGIAYYNYRIIDTQSYNNGRFYHLVFTPKRRGENTFEGDCWVHAGSFAIQKMNLRLGKDANINFLENLSLIQEYALIDSTTWFLSKDKFVADLSPIGKERAGFIGRKTTTYRNVMVDDTSVVNQLNKNKLLEEVIALPDAEKKDKSYWTDARHEQLSKNEAAIIKMIDTLTHAPVFKKFTNTLNFIGTGYLNTGNYQLGPWFNWMTANAWEGFRVRFDLGTNRRFNKKIWLHTYLAYGFGDKALKGKAEALWLLKKHPRTYIYGSYTHDLDFGQSYYGEVTTDNIFALAIRKPNIPIKFMKVDEKRLEFYHQTHSGFSVLLSANNKSYNPLQNIPPRDSFSVKSGQVLTGFEVSMKLRFAYLEKYLESNFFRTSLGSPYPIPELYIAKGIAGILNSAYDYTKISGSIYDYMKLPPFGSIEFYLFGGKTFGTLPYTFLDIAPGNELYYYNKFAFNLMNKYEFVHDKYAGINFEHNIGNGIFRLLPRLRFRQFWNVKVLWGSLSEANHNLNFKTGNTFASLNGNTYMEIGTGIDNILRIFRVDLVWRVLPQPLPTDAVRRFGVFGSLRLSF